MWKEVHIGRQGHSDYGTDNKGEKEGEQETIYCGEYGADKRRKGGTCEVYAAKKASFRSSDGYTYLLASIQMIDVNKASLLGWME